MKTPETSARYSIGKLSALVNDPAIAALLNTAFPERTIRGVVDGWYTQTHDGFSVIADGGTLQVTFRRWMNGWIGARVGDSTFAATPDGGWLPL